MEFLDLFRPVWKNKSYASHRYKDVIKVIEGMRQRDLVKVVKWIKEYIEEWEAAGSKISQAPLIMCYDESLKALVLRLEDPNHVYSLYEYSLVYSYKCTNAYINIARNLLYNKLLDMAEVSGDCSVVSKLFRDMTERASIKHKTDRTIDELRSLMPKFAGIIKKHPEALREHWPVIMQNIRKMNDDKKFHDDGSPHRDWRNHSDSAGQSDCHGDVYNHTDNRLSKVHTDRSNGDDYLRLFPAFYKGR